MAEYDAATVDRLAQTVLFAEWRRLIAAGWVSPSLLLDWRHRPAGHEFMPTPARELMALDVAEALAGMLGCEATALARSKGAQVLSLSADGTGSALSRVNALHASAPPGPGREPCPLLPPEQRRIRALIAAHTRWSEEDPAANAARGQAGLLAKFERQIRTADPTLPDGEVARRAESARQAHMARLALASSKARAARKAGGNRAAS